MISDPTSRPEFRTTPRRRSAHLTIVCLAAIALAACGRGEGTAPGAEPESTGAFNARPETVEALLADRRAERHASDGSGHAWLEADTPSVVPAGTPGRFTVVWEAGPGGLNEGGTVFFQIPAFWGWSPPQFASPDHPGYVTVETDAAGVELQSGVVDRHLVAARLTNGSLRRGQRVSMIYGAGSQGALADRYAERRSAFLVAVDGNADGVRAFVADPPTIEIAPGPPARMVLTLPTTARPGQTVTAVLAVLDRFGNAGCDVEGAVEFDAPGDLVMPGGARMEPGGGGRLALQLSADEPGTYRVVARGPRGLRTESNPMIVSAAAPRVLWGDLQVHTNFSDGSGTPRDVYAYARDVAALDVAAITDHDHWGTPFVDDAPAIWGEIRDQTRSFNEPGRFVTFLGYEWTNWIYGHRHVLFAGDAGEVLSSLDPAYDTPPRLWAALEGTGAMTIAHHSAGDPVATDWSIPPDPDFETVVEIVSVHGSSEAQDSPLAVRGARAGNFVRDALDRGYRLGFIGSGDGHDGHPGLGHLGAATGGLAAILSEEHSREGVLAALRARRAYATSGPRIFLDVKLGDRGMGSALAAPVDGMLELSVRVVAAAPLDRVDVIRSGSVRETVRCDGRLDVDFRRPVADLGPGDYLYVRAIQNDGGMAWSSPFFLTAP